MIIDKLKSKFSNYEVAKIDEKPMFILDYLEKYPDEKSAYIGLFILNTAYHEQGFGKIIFDGLVEISKELNFSEIHLGCMKKNERGYKFWNKNGFAIIGEVMHNIDDVDFEIYRMKKSLKC